MTTDGAAAAAAAIIDRYAAYPDALRVRAPMRLCHEAVMLGKVGDESGKFGVGGVLEVGKDCAVLLVVGVRVDVDIGVGVGEIVFRC